MTIEEQKRTLNSRVKTQMQEYLCSLSWEEKVASIERMNEASKLARKAMAKAVKEQPSK